MKKTFLRGLFSAGLSLSALVPGVAHATTYVGNGNIGFNGAVGNGTLSLTTNSSGGFVFAFTLGGAQTNLGGNDLVIYIDNGNGSGIGTSTAALTDTNDGGRQAASGYSGTMRSTTSFSTFLSPQFALDLSANNANVYSLVNNGTFGFNGGQTVGGTSQGSVTYTVTTVNGNTVFTETVPATDLGLTAFGAATLKLFALQVSETGFTSNEATVAVTGSSGYGNTQTISSANTFTVPEPSTWVLLGVGGVGLLGLTLRRRTACPA